MTLAKLVLLVAGLTLVLGRETIAAGSPGCTYALADVRSPPRFQDYPVRPVRIGRLVEPRLASRDARMFRSVIRDAVANGPNFAGHYTVAVWGCGAACSGFAIVDALSGHVVLPRGLGDIAGFHVADAADAGAIPDHASVRFQRSSRLLILLGAPEEDAQRDGIGFYEWTGRQLNLLRFVSGDDLCQRHPPEVAR